MLAKIFSWSLLAFFTLGYWLPTSAQTRPAFELDHRIGLSVERLADTSNRPAFTPAFILADVDLKPEDPRRFYNFSGDLSGRYLEVMSLLPEEQRRAAHLDKLARDIIRYQRADGRFGDPNLQFTADEIGGEHMALLWGNGRLLVGLMTYYEQTEDREVLAAARRLGDFFIGTAEACRGPEIIERLNGFGAKGIICFTQYIEGLAMLAKATDDERYVEAARDAYTIMPERGQQHSHGYLSTLRGVLMLYEITDDKSVLDYATTTFDDLLASDDHTIYGAVMEYFGGKGARDEGCSTADFVRLALHMHELTGDRKYLEAGERGLVNSLANNQYPSGDFGNHFFDDSVIKASGPMRAWWCCTMHGLRALIDVKDRFSVRKSAGTTTLHLLQAQEYDDGKIAFSLEELPAAEGREGFLLTIERWDETELFVPLPQWAENWKTTVNGAPAEQVRRKPVAGDVISLSANFKLNFNASDEPAANLPPLNPTNGYLTYGPYVMGINQSSFTAEPNWYNQVLFNELQPAGYPRGLSSRFRHSGYPGLNDVMLIPVGDQLYFDHPFMRVRTNYGRTVVPRNPDGQ